ncbi:sialyltransferase family protein [Klebsormidium nitens]|uniref:Sialyltransferase family protein n=1 Tax=Klebsormidium nitens TaxID=105231 RepID=A0A1Y1HK19_KLENI|nr:sialyltransferase family protein [Klebsormidium nitens]|eukprot:GAQ78900.1 sialyltransferase family protein [Klebsormidium nitens]
MCLLFSERGISDEHVEGRTDEEKEGSWILRRKLGPEQGDSIEGRVNAGSLELPKITLRALASREEIQKEVKAAEAQLETREQGAGSDPSKNPILRGNFDLKRFPIDHAVLAKKLTLQQNSKVEHIPNEKTEAEPSDIPLRQFKLPSKEQGNLVPYTQGAEPALGTTTSLTTLPEVRPPEKEVSNCKLCPAPVIPQFCSYAPHPLAPLDSLLKLDQGIVSRFSWSSQALAALDPATASQAPFEPPPEEVRSTVSQLLDQWQSPKSSCGIWTRDCVRRHLSGEHLPNVPTGPERCFVDGRFPVGKDTEQVLQLFPDLKEGVFGSCAVVAVSHNLLGKGRGPEIDAHDTVFRFNAPQEGFRKDVGARSTILYWKGRGREHAYGQEGQTAEWFYMFREYPKAKFFKLATAGEQRKLKFRRKQALWTSGLPWEVGHQIYEPLRKLDPLVKMSNGFEIVLGVISSGLCSRVDLYGFSAQGNGKYFVDVESKNLGAQMLFKHVAGLEHWVYREAMARGMLCIYD